MPQICPKIAQDISKICLRYAQALPKVWGFILRKWDKMSPGRVHQLGQYVSGEVHNAVGQFVLGTKCLLTQKITQPLLKPQKSTSHHTISTHIAQPGVPNTGNQFDICIFYDFKIYICYSILSSIKVSACQFVANLYALL